MKKYLTLIFALSLFIQCKSQINWNKVKKQANQVINTGQGGLTNEEIISGLKEALTVGSNNAGSLASKTDGYFKNPKIFIPFPPEAKQVEAKLRQLGFGNKVDQFNLTLNRAAEEAAKKAAPIFVDAVKGMTITDGLSILKGGDNAATNYLKTNTNTALTTAFTPVVKAALDKTLATKYWTDLVTIYNKVPGVKKVNPNLTQYATTKAIDGLFLLVGDEEAKIRKDPAARVSDILKKVFANAGK